ncbi:hypothetical protein LTR62_000762 [Meristemomyces frigidus]|uniref:Uncharacterized protein n=1 Tax=Meristemomyces frigidus TaxID=1508187 RepID=A0AAN7TM76_9PEZI|nr:hypothetical protein LTR62_000762 [Meristemomyces frigidus]
MAETIPDFRYKPLFKALTASEPLTLLHEAQESIVHLQDTDPAVVFAMLWYLYTDNYEDYLSTSESPAKKAVAPALFDIPASCPAVVFDVQVLIEANMRGTPPLAELAAKKLKQRTAEGWKPTGFADAIELMFTKAPDQDFGLRDIAVQAANSARSAVEKGPGVLPGDNYQTLCD